MRKGENSLLELMPALRYGGEGRCLSLPCFRSTGKGVMGSSGEGLQVLGSSWAARHSDPIPAELRAPVPAPQGAQMGCF